MSHPAFWPTTVHFYPVGNTPPLNLTQNLPPEQDANILLLGCGDPRNILYTLYAVGADCSPGTRRFDFTCCDIEPAIFARNILLFTLVADGTYSENFAQIWNIFYHFFIDDATYALLLSQTRKLVEMSVDLETWETSKYSSFLRVSNKFTLSELNRMWTLYAATGSFTAKQTQRLRNKFTSGMKGVAAENEGNLNATGARAAGPLYFNALSLGVEAYRSFWQTGVTFDEPKELKAATIVNPTFAYATQGEGFVAHYSTSPLPFHLATVFAPTANPPHDSAPTIFDVFREARSQFQRWTDALHICWTDGKKSGRVTVRFILGDVFAVCRTLQRYAECSDRTAYERTSPWTSALLALDGMDYGDTDHPAPRLFDVIDSSNLIDSLGMLNILISAAPLLSRSPSAVLQTETLLATNDDYLVSLTENVFADPSTMFVLLDLVPSHYLSGFTTQSNIHEITGFATQSTSDERPLFHSERMTWKILSLLNIDGKCLRPSIESSQLSALLFHVYIRMFAYENPEAPMATDLTRLLGHSPVHYCRRSFALLIRFMLDRISTNKAEVFGQLIPRIFSDRQLMFSANFYRDFLCQLHLLGIHSDDMFSPNNPLILSTKTKGRFRRWTYVPSVVCLAFSVPRSKFSTLNSDETPPEPLLVVQVRGRTFNNSFSSIQMSFGRLSVQDQDEDLRVLITEEIRAESPVVAYIWVPTWVLSREPPTTSIILSILRTPLHAKLADEVEFDVDLFTASLMDANKIHITRQAPISLNEHDSSAASIPPSIVSPEQLIQPVSDVGPSIELDKTCQRVSCIKLRIQISEEKVKAELAKSETAVSVVVHDVPYRAHLAIGQFTKRIDLPIIADMSKSRLRIARGLSWIEVIASTPDSGSFTLDSFPILRCQHNLSLWNIHRVNLERLPTLNVDEPERLSWLNSHISFMPSDRELKRKAFNQELPPLTQIKETLYDLIAIFAGIQQEQATVFGLASSAGTDTIIFATDLRLDLSGHTVVLDAFVLPVEHRLAGLDSLKASLAKTRHASVSVNNTELIAWKYLLPALVERCRTWEHKEDCTYLQRGVPLSTAHHESPICDCGRGIVDSTFERREEWAVFAPHVTRIAISPLFAASYLRPVRQLEVLKALLNPQISEQEQVDREPQCAKCGKIQAKLLVCSRCKKVSYCDKDCQVADWGKHKALCRKI